MEDGYIILVIGVKKMKQIQHTRFVKTRKGLKKTVVNQGNRKDFKSKSPLRLKYSDDVLSEFKTKEEKSPLIFKDGNLINTKRELTYEELSPLARKGIKKYSSVSLSDMKIYSDSYEKETGKSSSNVLNKEDFFTYVAKHRIKRQ